MPGGIADIARAMLSAKAALALPNRQRLPGLVRQADRTAVARAGVEGHGLDVQVRDAQRIVLDELAAGFDDVAH
jgi:hypothetical protein